MMMSFRHVRNPTIKNRIMATVIARPSVTEFNWLSAPDSATCCAFNARRPLFLKPPKYGNQQIDKPRPRTNTSAPMSCSIPLREPELTLAKRCQVRGSATANKIDFEVVGREIRGCLAREEGSALPGKICRVLRASNGAADIHDATVAIAIVRIFNRMHYVGMPEHRIARLHQRNRCKSGSQGRVPCGMN